MYALDSFDSAVFFQRQLVVKDCELLESENLSLKEVTFQTPAGFGMKPAIIGDPLKKKGAR